jgi:hypothetical protein
MFVRPHLPKQGVVVHTFCPSDTRKHKTGSQSSLAQGQKQDPISKIARTKIPGSMAQVVEGLPNNYEAMSSNPSTTKKKFIL